MERGAGEYANGKVMFALLFSLLPAPSFLLPAAYSSTKRPSMLPIELVREISRLLDEGELSQRQIAARLGVGRTTVGAIASGQRGLNRHDELVKMARARAGRRRPVRCSRCGYRVYMPCLICIAREYRQQQLSGFRPPENRTKRRNRSSRARSRAD
jgi:predicted XRE-type DNA-binding protein